MESSGPRPLHDYQCVTAKKDTEEPVLVSRVSYSTLLAAFQEVALVYCSKENISMLRILAA